MFVKAILGIAVGLMIAALGNDCEAQAFFPLARVNDTSTDTYVTIDLQSFALCGPFAGPANTGPVKSYTDNDTNYTIVVDASTVEDGDSHADSEALAEAETLPSASSSLMLAQCITNIGGLWELASCNTGIARIWNDQLSFASGDFKIKRNPTYPSVTLGTLYVTFDIDFVSVDWDNASVNSHCGASYVNVAVAGGVYYAYGYLEGYGSFYDSGDAAGPLVYTAVEDVEVCEVISMSTMVRGWLNNPIQVAGGASASAIPGLSATTSFYVDER